jgi:tetratricopeptide (TPR) repeat protein
LKVISRTSVMRYQPGAPRNLREISEQLRVAYVLEGSVQRTDGKVRVTAQLRDATRDTQVWAEAYERGVADVFGIESEIAQAVARQLRTTLSPAEKTEIERKPTRDLSAFTLYTRGKALIEEATSGGNIEPNFAAGIELLQQAVARDPRFLVAYCQLAHAHATIALYGIDNTPARLAAAEAAVDAARRLSPDSGDTHLAAARVLYAGLQYERASEELEIARRVLPNDPRIIEASAYILRRQGRWEDSTRQLERALEFDPLNADLLQDLSSNYEALHRYADWTATVDRAIAVRPERIGLHLVRALVPMEERADTQPTRAVLEAAVAEHPGAAKTEIDSRLHLAFAERDFAEIANALADLGDRPYGNDWSRFSRAFGEGLLARMSGDDAGARRAFAAARIKQLALVEAQPAYGPAVSMLGLIEAGLGHKEEALRLGRRAIELLPVEKDAIRGPYMIAHLAKIAAWVGEKDLALEQMHLFEKLTPAGFHYGRLKLDPMWDPLRGEPRFEAIVAARAPAGVK